LVAGQSNGSFSTEGGAVSKTADIAEGAYTFQMADTYGDGICCRYGSGEFKITVNGEPVAISISNSSGESRDFVRESFDVVGAVMAAPSTSGWMLRTMTIRMRRVGRYATV
jgi:hypothetical protein